MLHPKYRVKAANKRKVLNIVRNSAMGITSTEVANIAGLAKPYTVSLLYLLRKRNKLFSQVVESPEKTYVVYQNCSEIKQ